MSDPRLLPAGMRNNNPGNIKFIPNLPYAGIVGPSVNTDQGDPQAVFSTPEAGMNAMMTLAMRKYTGGKVTANDLIAGQGGWTPGHTVAAANVARGMGLRPDQDLNLTDPNQRFLFARALMQQEHGTASAQYPDELVWRAASGPFPVQQAALPVQQRSLGAMMSGRAPSGADLKNLSPKARSLMDALMAGQFREGAPGVNVVSGYRDPQRNARAGGAGGSQHLHGNAIDIDVKGWSDAEKQKLLQAAVARGARGVGLYPSGNSIHLDVRDTPALWGGNPNAPYAGHGADLAPTWARGVMQTLLANGGGVQGATQTAYPTPQKTYTAPAQTQPVQAQPSVTAYATPDRTYTAPPEATGMAAAPAPVVVAAPDMLSGGGLGAAFAQAMGSFMAAQGATAQQAQVVEQQQAQQARTRNRATAQQALSEIDTTGAALPRQLALSGNPALSGTEPTGPDTQDELGSILAPQGPTGMGELPVFDPQRGVGARFRFIG